MSCYGLVDAEMILSPVPTGQWIELRYQVGYTYRYVAYKATEMQQVNIYCLDKSNIESIKYYQLVTVSRYEARPDSLVYLDHGFPVFDLQVKLCNKCQSYL